MESPNILKVKEQLKDPIKMFETCWLLGCPTKTQNPGLKDYGLSKAIKTEFCIQTSRPALKSLHLELRIGSDVRIPPHSSIEAEEELEQPFNAGTNHGRDKEDK
jgi:hypothetical protein